MHLKMGCRKGFLAMGGFVCLEQKLPPQAAGNFLLNGKKSPKNVSLLFA
jgi:hypothetical protein